MFYIDKHIPKKRRDFIFIHWVPPLIMFVAFFGITLLSWRSALEFNASEQQRVLDQRSNEVSTQIESRIKMYQDTLRAGVGLYGASDDVTREEWRRFLQQFDLKNRYPGIQGVGFTDQLAPDEVEPFIESLRAEGFSNVTIKPEGQRQSYTAVKYIEPFEGDNINELGFDMFSNPTRRTAMELARDNASIALTEMVVLERDKANPQPGFLMYAPIYVKGAPTNSVELRRSNLEGYVFAPLRAQELFDEITIQEDKFGFQLFAPRAGEESLMYKSSSYETIRNTDGSRTSSRNINIDNTTWKLIANVNNDVINARERERPSLIIWGGITMSVLIASFVYLLLINRTRILAARDDQTVQEAKDELLALASHQLRTPATGVKQYVGLLREGFAGALTDQQQKLLDKAYASNERQLSTINEILFIARADAGDMKLNLTECNLNDLLRDIVDEQQQSIHDQQLKATIRIPRNRITLEADVIYLRMALENIVNNAVKYTPDSGKISVVLTRLGDYAQITVKDSGVGVAPKDHPLLFQKFSRIPNELTNKVSGSGIGLYLAQQVVLAHNGRIDFQSQLGKGSEFTVTLPLNK